MLFSPFPKSKEKGFGSVGRWVQHSVKSSALLLLLPPSLPPTPSLFSPCLPRTLRPHCISRILSLLVRVFCQTQETGPQTALEPGFQGGCQPAPYLPALPPQLLEYLGKGKSIVDVGLAQARHPLSTRSHYFEVEIVDPGEKCYIALGLARKVGIVFAYRASQLRGCWDGAGSS